MKKTKDNKIVFIWKTIKYHLKHDSWSLIWATWFWTGLIPPIPPLNGLAGTYGSLAAIPFALLALETHWIIYLFFSAVIFKIGINTVEDTEDELGPRKDYKKNTKTRDQNQIVIDEVIGIFVTYFIMYKIFSFPVNFSTCTLGFLLFRGFDLAKKLPGIYIWHEKFHNAFGVMMDDVVAAVYAGLVSSLIIVAVNNFTPFF